MRKNKPYRVVTISFSSFFAISSGHYKYASFSIPFGMLNLLVISLFLCFFTVVN